MRQFDTPACRDYAVTLEKYEKNVEEMILKVKDNVKGIFICTPYYIEPNGEDMMRKRMDEYGAVCKKTCGEIRSQTYRFSGVIQRIL